MTLRAIYDSVAEIPKELSSHYAEAEGGKYILQVEKVGGWALEDVDGLKSALGKERRAAEELSKTLKDFEGLDAKKVRRALIDLEKFEAIDPEKESDRLSQEKFEAARKQLVEKHEQDMDALRGETGTLRKVLDKVGRRNAAIAAIAASKGNVQVLLPHVLDRLKLDFQGEEVNIAVVDSSGNPRISDAKGSLMNVDQLLEEMRNDKNFATCFEGTGNSGAGIGTTGSPNNRGSSTKVVLGASKEEQNAAINRRIGSA